MKTSAPLLLAVLGLFAAMTLFAPQQADAQKKSKAKTTVQKPKEAVEEETATEEPAPQPPASISGGIVDIMKKYVGQQTNLGTLKKVNREYVEFQDENTVLTVPITNVHSLKQVTEKDENDSTVVHLEVRLTAKD